MKLRVTPRAFRQLDEIAAYVAVRNASAAIRVGLRIQEMLDFIQEFPFIGHCGALRATKELPVPDLPFVIVYRIEKKKQDQIAVIGIYHSSQRRPGQ